MKNVYDINHMLCALIFCTAFEEIRQFIRIDNKTRAEKRSIFVSKFQQLNNLAIQNG
ncbi:MAG: hypothetical protein HRT87_03225 [Legionellales bacterium]|nr:hypothetical protein [Legionellales bacterium]